MMRGCCWVAGVAAMMCTSPQTVSKSSVAPQLVSTTMRGLLRMASRIAAGIFSVTYWPSCSSISGLRHHVGDVEPILASGRPARGRTEGARPGAPFPQQRAPLVEGSHDKHVRTGPTWADLVAPADIATRAGRDALPRRERWHRRWWGRGEPGDARGNRLRRVLEARALLTRAEEVVEASSGPQGFFPPRGATLRPTEGGPSNNVRTTPRGSHARLRQTYKKTY